MPNTSVLSAAAGPVAVPAGAGVASGSEPVALGTALTGEPRERPAQRVTHRPALLFMISDFHDENFGMTLKAANQRHDVLALQVIDPRESVLPDVGVALVRDAESGVDYRAAVPRADFDIEAAVPAVHAIWEEVRTRGLEAVGTVLTAGMPGGSVEALGVICADI